MHYFKELFDKVSDCSFKYNMDYLTLCNGNIQETIFEAAISEFGKIPFLIIID